jgi:predicted protein tyrosine phosphatase
MTLPTLHLNGTPATDLRHAYLAAMDAVQDAQDAVRQTAPNGRDYYPQGPDAINAAQEEHASRLAALQRVFDELQELAVHCMEGGR